MLQALLKWLGSAMGPSRESLEQDARTEAWVAALSATEARALAEPILANAVWFRVERGQFAATLPDWLPSSLREFLEQYARVEARECNFRLTPDDWRPSPTETPLLQIGWQDEHVELTVSPVDGRIYLLAEDTPGDDLREGSYASVYHAILALAASLDYIQVPGGAA